MHVTYVANAGFIVSAGGRRLLIDALFGHWDWDWCDVPPLDAVAKMRNAQDPFDGAAVVLITHAHADHFDPEIVAQYLERNASCTLVAPPQVATALARRAGWEAIRRRVTVPELGPGQSTELSANGVSIRVWRLAHGPYMEEDPATGALRNRHEAVEHFVFRCRLGQEQFLHTGDWMGHDRSEPSPAAGCEDGVEVMFLGPGAYENFFATERPLELGASTSVVLMHLQPGGRLEGEDPALTAVFSRAFRFQRPMTTREFPSQLLA